MRELFERIDAYPLTPWHLLWLVIPFAALWLMERRSKRRDAAGDEQEMARLRFQAAQRKAEEIFEDPTRGRDNPAYFWAVKEALDLWEMWQRRPLSTLQDVGCDPTEAEWHAIQLLNSIPLDETTEHVM